MYGKMWSGSVEWRGAGQVEGAAQWSVLDLSDTEAGEAITAPGENGVWGRVERSPETSRYCTS